VPQVRCPQCGAVNDTRAPDYPFCVGCQNNLATCGYCRWFNDEAGVCTSPSVAGVFDVSEDSAPPCGCHTPRDAVLVRRWGRWALVAVGLATALFALGYAVSRALVPAAGPPRSPAELQWDIAADYRGAAVGEPYTVMAQFYNRSDQTIEGVRFEIDQQSLEKFDLRSVRPGPSGRDQSERWQGLCYPDMHPRERRTIALELVPKSAGTFHLIVRLISGDQVYHGMADLPIVVGARGESALSRSGGAEEEKG
jgi:hypothetical protein